jgi:hypothetical protein
VLGVSVHSLTEHLIFVLVAKTIIIQSNSGAVSSLAGVVAPAAKAPSTYHKQQNSFIAASQPKGSWQGLTLHATTAASLWTWHTPLWPHIHDKKQHSLIADSQIRLLAG